MTSPKKPTPQQAFYLSASSEVIRILENYEPKTSPADWPDIRDFVRDVVARSCEKTPYSAVRVLGVAAPFVSWCTAEQGLEASTDLFSRRLIDTFCRTLDRSEATRSTYRSTLLTMGKVLSPDANLAPIEPLSRRSINAPYTVDEVEGFRSWAAGQPSQQARRKARLLLALCAGAGLRPGEVVALQVEDVTDDECGILITVRDKDKVREVPMLRSWEGLFRAGMQDAPDEGNLWLSIKQAKGANSLNRFTAATVGVPPNSHRLRASWIVAQLRARAPIKEIMRAAGITQFGNLHQYVPYLADLTSADARAALRGETE